MNDKETMDFVDKALKESDELAHAGIKGMKWGRRRYQNPDGSLTPEGKIRYGVGEYDPAAEAEEVHLPATTNNKVSKSVKNHEDDYIEAEVVEDRYPARTKGKAKVDEILGLVPYKPKTDNSNKSKDDDSAIEPDEIFGNGKKSKITDPEDGPTVNGELIEAAKAKVEKKNSEKKNTNQQKESKAETEPEKNKTEDSKIKKNKTEDPKPGNKKPDTEPKVKNKNKKPKDDDPDSKAKLDAQIGKLNKYSKIADQVSEGATRAEKLNDTIGGIRNKKQTRQELATMDDATLQKKLNRMRLDDEYTNRMKNRRTAGHEFVSNTLNILGTAASFTATGLTIAALIKDLKK